MAVYRIRIFSDETQSCRAKPSAQSFSQFPVGFLKIFQDANVYEIVVLHEAHQFAFPDKPFQVVFSKENLPDSPVAAKARNIQRAYTPPLISPLA